ncbi:hypothetical protein C5B85_16585 [Pseudoclavibacter sp. AY1F1]|uniref:hypothetical protein n=1 Tax=Pseudoclavibacter sp. AY1F1 TaxID=2080583 RepID=UPI000CE8FD68|nr:hypothetical protein [Pseudoclavibacter sp. AY1F1]PPF42380.1 hypothetical protein C5B85_16585 [Pseudoclavibacter sp. AY1F1]
MSTFNPRDVAAQRDAAKRRRVGGGPALAVLLLMDFGLAAGGFLGAVGLSSLFFITKLEETNTFPLVALLPLLIPAGIFMSVGFLIAQAVARRAYTGAPDFTRALTDGQPVWFGGAAVGAWGSLAALLLLTTISGGPIMSNGDGPPVVDETPWAIEVLPWVLPSLLTLGLALSVWRRIARARRTRRTTSTFEAVFATGTRTSGIVTQGVERPRESTRVVSRWTIQFTDVNGQTRWTTPWGLFHEESLPAAGDAVTVIYDPTIPGDESRILIAREHPDRIESYRAHKPPFPFGP